LLQGGRVEEKNRKEEIKNHGGKGKLDKRRRRGKEPSSMDKQ